MSKQSEAKDRQQYTPKLIPNVCGNCAHYKSSTTTRQGIFGGTYTDEANKHCGIGGFAVKKMGSCAEWCGTELATGATHA